MQQIYAAIWKATEPDATFQQEEFESRLPRLMEWLRSLYASGNLVACGGGGFEDYAGGLTLIRAESHEQAAELSNGTPMNEIGTTELFLWDVYFADLHEESHIINLQKKPEEQA